MGSLGARAPILHTDVGGAIFAAGVGGGASAISGGDFIMGAGQGLGGYLLNHLPHKQGEKGKTDRQASGGNVIDNTSLERGLSTIANTYVGGAMNFVQNHHNGPVLDFKMSPKSVKNVGVVNRALKMTGRALGIISITDHGLKAYNAFQRGENRNGWINASKVALDGIFILGKASNPIILFGGITYTVWDMSGTME